MSPLRRLPGRVASSDSFIPMQQSLDFDVQLVGPLSPISIPSDHEDNVEITTDSLIVDLTDESPLTVQSTALPPTAECQCPVSLSCPRRANDQMDCRFLVVPWRYWSLQPRQPSAWVALELDDTTVIRADRLSDIVTYIHEIEHTPRNTTTLQQTFLALGDWVVEAGGHDLTRDILDRTEILPYMKEFLSDVNTPLRRQKRMPTWLTEDLTYLFRKWERGDLQCHPNRGLRCVQRATVHGDLTTKYLLDKTWSHYVDARHFGEGTLVNGQHWSSRVQMCRDGAHAEILAGISGTREDGAYSLILSRDSRENKTGYANVDLGPVIWYQGTSLRVIQGMEHAIAPNNVKDDETQENANLDDPQPTDDTLTLMRSIETKIPVRVIRGFRLAQAVTNKPVMGYRYDGLYRVMKKLLQKKDRQIWTFKLVRLQQQGPLRGFGLDKVEAAYAIERRLNGQKNKERAARRHQPRNRRVSEYR